MRYAVGMDAAIDIEAMTPEERWDLIERLWRSLEEMPVELTQPVREELDRRVSGLDRDIAAGRPIGATWDEARVRVFGPDAS